MGFAQPSVGWGRKGIKMIKIDLSKLTNGTVICIVDELGCELEYPDSEDREDFVIYIRKIKQWLEERYGMYNEWGVCMDVDKVMDKIEAAERK